MCLEIADSVTKYLGMICKELGEAANGDVKYRTLVKDYAE